LIEKPALLVFGPTRESVLVFFCKRISMRVC